MELERKNRLKEKIEISHKRIDNIEETLGAFEKEISKLACYKAFQELIEALTDIIAMLLSDKNKTVEDDYTNIEKIKEVIEFEKRDVEILKEANGLRNRLVHKYNRTDDETAKESITTLLPEVKRILDKFEEEIKNEKI